MALPEETVWKIEPHTVAKHIILRTYLGAWFPILTRYNGRIIYIDGFAGSGRYADGEPGSPIIALECARTHRAKLTGELVFYFIEMQPDRAENLRKEIGAIELPSHFKVAVEEGTFAEKLSEALDKIDESGKHIAPTFALIDPFGFSGIPYSLVERLLSQQKCEILITIMVDSINRWLTHPDSKIQAHIIDTFGTDEAVAIAEGSGDRVTSLKDLYHRQLTKIAKFVRYFEMRDRKNRIVYYLFFASNNSLGHLKMKEAMWKVDPMGEFTFSDATDPEQEVMFSTPAIEPLVQDLASRFRQTTVLVKDIHTYVSDHTAYLSKHMREAFRQLESNGRVTIKDVKRNGQKRRLNTYPDDAIMTFS
jgi:three-Cys-motif partner protein